MRHRCCRQDSTERGDLVVSGDHGADPGRPSASAQAAASAASRAAGSNWRMISAPGSCRTDVAGPRPGAIWRAAGSRSRVSVAAPGNRCRGLAVGIRLAEVTEHLVPACRRPWRWCPARCRRARWPTRSRTAVRSPGTPSRDRSCASSTTMCARLGVRSIRSARPRRSARRRRADQRTEPGPRGGLGQHQGLLGGRRARRRRRR